jgi:hypothetical protein
VGWARNVARKYAKRPKNEFGTSLFPIAIQDVLEWFAARPEVEIIWMGPRYWPDWMRWVSDVRGVREVANWNTLVIFRRKDELTR